MIQEPTIINILSHPINNNNFKKSLVNEKFNQSTINNILKESSIDDKKLEIDNAFKKNNNL